MVDSFSFKASTYNKKKKIAQSDLNKVVQTT